MKEWQEFERAVAEFVAALDPSAAVKYNVRLPDKDTGRLRQRDVWIEATVCQIFPIKVLVSCKRWRNDKLSEQDIDAFVGELRSSGAHKGVLYSFSGYTEPAIRKADVLGICCCKLYENQPPDVPESLLFSLYCCVPTIRIRFLESPDESWGLETFDDLFSLCVSEEGREITVLDHLATLFEQGEEAAIKEMSESAKLPQPWTRGVEFSTKEAGKRISLRIALDIKWKVYRGRLEAHLLDGTYSFTSGEFRGTQIFPAIRVKGPNPGPDWELVEDPPTEAEPGVGIVVLSGGSFRDSAVQTSGQQVSRT